MFETVATEIPRLLACNGSRLLGGTKPPSNSDPTARNEGTAAHWLITYCFEQGLQPVDLIGTKAENGVTITHAIAASVIDYLNHIRSRTTYQHGIENSVDLTGNNWVVGCRPDFVSFNNSALEIDDFKHGFRIVEPKNNWTMICYAAAISQKNGWPHVQEIVFRVHQPRVPHPSGTVREWRITRSELLAFYQYLDNVLSNLSETLNSGSHCEGCPSVTVCPAVRTATFNAVDISLEAHAENLPDDVIGRELDILTAAEKRIKTRMKQLQDLAIYRLRKGAIIPGYAMETSLGNMTFKEEFSGEFLSSMLGVNVVKNDTITPTQAINAGANESLVKQFSTRKETGFRLTKVDANNKASKMFNLHSKGK